MELMGGWEASTIQNENPSFSAKVDFFPFPSMPGGKGDPRDVIGTVGDGFMSISTECKDPAAAFKLGYRSRISLRSIRATASK